MASEKGPNNDQPQSPSQASPEPTSNDQSLLEVESSAKTTPSGRNRFSFWICFISLCMSLFLFAMELTSVSTALPTITRDLQLTEFVWVGAAYALASAAWIPLCGNFAEIFGRRSTMIASVTLFAVGSAMCGAAKNSATMIAGRTIQGLGGGAIVALGDIILGDLVPLKERPMYFSLMGLTWGVACSIGPIVGGSLASEGQWRWLFYLNVPICGLTILLFAIFMRLRTPPGSFMSKVRKVDWVGNAVIMASSSACAIALSWGGVKFPWGSGHVLGPLIVGLVGLVAVMFYEHHIAKFPIIPWSLVSNRTSASGYIQNLISPMITLAAVYFVPIYYQACKGSSPLLSGVQTLGLAANVPAAIAGGITVGITQKYRPPLWLGWCLVIVGSALLTTIGADTKTGTCVGYTVILGVGVGLVYAVAQFPVQSPLPVSENARSMALFAFIRAFASIWGVSIGNTALQNELSKRLPSAFIQLFPQGTPLAYAIIPEIAGLQEPLRTQVRLAFAGGLQLMWKVLVGLGAAGLVASFFMREIPMHVATDENWALENEANLSAEKGRKDTAGGGSA